MKQIRLPISELTELMSDLITSNTEWCKAVEKYGLFTSTEMTEEEMEKKAEEKPNKKEQPVKKD